MLSVCVVLCMPSQYQVFPPLAAIIAARRRGVLQIFLPIFPAGLGGAHHESGVGCPYWWLHGPIHPKYILWGCSLAILQAAPSWWRYPAEVNQWLPGHSEVWCYRLDSGSFYRNAAWQIALRFSQNAPACSPVMCLSESTRRDLATLWKAPQTCTEPPWAWTL